MRRAELKTALQRAFTSPVATIIGFVGLIGFIPMVLDGFAWLDRVSTPDGVNPDQQLMGIPVVFLSWSIIVVAALVFTGFILWRAYMAADRRANSEIQSVTQEAERITREQRDRHQHEIAQYGKLIERLQTSLAEQTRHRSPRSMHRAAFEATADVYGFHITKIHFVYEVWEEGGKIHVSLFQRTTFVCARPLREWAVWMYSSNQPGSLKGSHGWKIDGRGIAKPEPKTIRGNSNVEVYTFETPIPPDRAEHVLEYAIDFDPGVFRIEEFTRTVNGKSELVRSDFVSYKTAAPVEQAIVEVRFDASLGVIAKPSATASYGLGELELPLESVEVLAHVGSFVHEGKTVLRMEIPYPILAANYKLIWPLRAPASTVRVGPSAANGFAEAKPANSARWPL